MQPLAFRDLRYIGTVTFQNPPSGCGGELQYAQGLAIRRVGDDLRAAVAFSRSLVQEYRLPDALTGAASYVATLGKPQKEDSAVIWGLTWDEDEPDTLWAASHIDYDTDTGWARTVSRSRLQNGTLVQDGFWNFTCHSDKQTSGGVVPIPEAFRTHVGGHRLAVGFGGYQSIAATGPVSMGPALTAFTPPDDPTDTIDDVPLQGYRYGTDPNSNPRQLRPIDYVNDFSDNSGFPQYPTEDSGGHWCWTDVLLGAGAWIVSDDRWGVLTVGTLGCDRCWYGSTGDGTPSAINSEHMTHCWFLTDPADLARVATGQCYENRIQAAFEPVQLPGVTYPMPGMPTGVIQKALAACWTDDLLGILVAKMGPKIANVATPVILFYEVAPPTLPLPDPPTAVTVY